MGKQINLQDVMLNQVRKDKMPVDIFMTNGFRQKGVIKGFDNFVIVLEVEGKFQMIYKHAISTIVPLRKINIMAASEEYNK